MKKGSALNKSRLRIGVLAGGSSSEREVSLRSGQNILNALHRLGYMRAEIIDSDYAGLKKLFSKKFDLVFNILHGGSGEDGTIQGFLETLNIQFIGSSLSASVNCMNKVFCKYILQETDIPTPEFIHIPCYAEISPDIIQAVKVNIGFPCIIKPVSEGSSVGVRIIKEEAGFLDSLKKLHLQFKEVFIERFIPGPNITVGVIEKFDELISLPILELVPTNEFYDYEAKYTAGKTQFIIPARLPEEVYGLCLEIAERVFRIFKCRDFARVDMIVEKGRFPLVHDINTIPGMTDLSDLPAEAAHAGIGYDDLIEILLLNGIRRNEKEK
ncbi:MAG TPA: D-alanine--D-alanine ligase [Firmicutes bacterium]|nr:D-alanine--D-alanine ligase [Bacillota bacterium]